MLYPGGKDEDILFDDGKRRLVVSARHNSVDQEFVRVERAVQPFYEYIQVRCGDDKAKKSAEGSGVGSEMGP